ncbi:hypothetical protein DPMN_182172 [Dreissena polymorpha]|uniref:Uncharacterized protein n=2 Tax=Dreissena polymorpha TaxID=45954 RepID=A0A9D4DGM5_DREPO|nr:hypothetical protein DPMN_182172 [Dreissena polymorpha]
MKSIQLLLAENANRSSSVNERDMSEGTPLHHACDWGHLEVVEYLLKKDGDVNMTDENGFSPFLIAAGWGREDVMKALLTRPVNPLIVDNQKNNVLHICGATGREGIINMLLEKFPDEMQRLVMLRNSYGWTPIDFSYRCGHYKTTKVLVKQILKLSTPRSLHSLSDPQTFVHTRFSVVRKEFFNFQERNLCRFIDENSDMPIFRIPRCKWHIHSSGKDEFYKTTEYVNKHEEKLRWCLAKN